VVFRSGSKNIDDLQQTVKEGVSRLRGLELGDELGVEILSQLVDGQKTPAEITELIYGLRSGDEGYKSSYGRVRREIRRLESKGLVSRKIFGLEKPCRLTDLAMINLARIGGGGKQIPLIPRIDIFLYTGTVISICPVAFIAMGWFTAPELLSIGVFGFFCVLFGVSLCRFVQAIRRVF